MARPAALPEKWIDKIFQRMEGRYGSLFLDRWRGCDMDNVRAVWADELAGFVDQPERIAYALRVLSDSQFPPTLPEFKAACRNAPTKELPRLDHKLSPEEIQRNRDRINQLASQLAASKSVLGF